MSRCHAWLYARGYVHLTENSNRFSSLQHTFDFSNRLQSVMSAAKPKDFDDLVAFLGDYGLFQVVVIVLLSMSAMPSGYMGMIVVFVSDTPEHHCRESDNSTRHLTGPDGCSRFPEGSENDTEPCADGWVFSTETYTATTVSEWALVCDNAWKVPFSTSLFFVGALFGSFISGHFSDRFGRKKIFFFIMVLQAATALIQASSVSWIMFCVLNFLRGVGQVASYISSLVLGSEMLTQSARLTFTLLGHSVGFGLGYALLPLLAYFIRGWRMLLVASAIPSILFIPMWWVIPESPRWLLQKGRFEEAELIIRKAAKWNRVPVPEVMFRADECLEMMQSNGEDKRAYTYMDLIRTPNMRNITILAVLLWTSVAIIFYGLSLNTSNLNGNVYLNCFISAAIDIAACIATWLLVSSVSRPTLLFCAMILCGIMLLIIQLVPDEMHIMFQAFALVGKMCVSGAYCFIYVVFTELMPTVVRNMGLGIASTFARIGTIICPYLIYLGVYSKILPYIIFGTISIVAAAISMLLPDTRDSKLPDLISQAKPIRGCCRPKETTA